MINPDLLRDLPLLLDGSPGDFLRRSGDHLRRTAGSAAGGSAQAASSPVEALNLSQPELVRAVHREFFAAGARALRTNTLDASALALAAHGLEERCEAVHNTAAALVREVIGRQGLLLGSVGAIRVPGAAPHERERAYAQQLVYLSDVGADFLVLEGLGEQEALRVRELARQVGDAPVLALLALAPDAKTLAAGALATLRAWAGGGLDALGLVAGPAAADLRPLVEPALLLGLPIAVLVQNAPLLQDASPAPALSPEEFADRLAPLAALGVTLLGGGAGIAPAHIRALGGRLSGRLGGG